MASQCLHQAGCPGMSADDYNHHPNSVYLLWGLCPIHLEISK